MTRSPLASIYSTSTMENHHFNMTINILQQEHHNIFAKLNPDEYKQVLGNMKHCILATDLALFFPNKARLNTLIRENAFSWDLPQHRLLGQALAMTGADLNSATKLWEVQYRTAQIIYAEFHEQVTTMITRRIDHRIDRPRSAQPKHVVSREF